MLWSRRNRQRADLAARITSPDDAPIDHAVEMDPALKAEAESLQRMLRAIPKTQPALDVDLLPLVKARLAQEAQATRRSEQPPRWIVRHWAPVAAACAAGLVAVASLTLLRPAAAPSVPVAQQVRDTTPIGLALEDVRSLLDQRQETAAYDRAMAALADHPRELASGELAMIAADLAFNMQRYDEAFAAYTRVRSDYSATLTDHPDWEKRVANRRDVLAEAKKSNYDSLYAFELARRDRTGSIAGYEDVISKYPDTLVASLATESIARVILDEQGLDPNDANDRILAMKTARDRCTHPVAVASLELEIGLAYINDFQDSSSAAEHITTASENPLLTQRVQNAMARLQSNAR